MTYFYPELVCLASFTVLCDCRNLVYYKTSTSPVLIHLRASLAGRYDLSNVRLQHVTRKHMFSDSLARLTSTESSIGALEIMASTYSYDAVELLSTPETSTSSFADVPDSFSREAFSEDELKMLATDSSAHLVGTQPVTRTIHYRLDSILCSR
jgi:hypothetical protein